MGKKNELLTPSPRVKRLEMFSFYDHSGMERRLEEMEAKGWRLVKIGTFAWTYEKSEPQKVKYAVTYDEKASAYDPVSAEGLGAEGLEHGGWKYVCSSGQMQFFRNDQADPEPFITNPKEEVARIHHVANRSSLWAHYLLLAISCLQLFLQIYRFVDDPIRFFGDDAQLLMIVSWLILLIFNAMELVTYYTWHRRAVRAAEKGEFLETKAYRKLQKALLAAALAFLLGAGVSIFGTTLRQKLLFPLFTLGIFVAVLLSSELRVYLQKKNVSRNANLAITIIVNCVVVFSMTGGLVFMLLSDLDHEPAPELPMEYPLRIEEFADVGDLNIQRSYGRRESLFLEQEYVWQGIMSDRGEQSPSFDYTITKIKNPVVYNICKNQILRERKDIVEGPDNVFFNHYEPVDESLWQATEAYQLVHTSYELGVYLICYENERELWQITYDTELTEKQMQIIIDNLQ